MAKIAYTAEQINHRLDLINENKNLLPYPYEYDSTLPLGLEDVGDGSFLTTTDIKSSTTVTIKYPNTNYSLLKGTYTISIEVTDVMSNSSSNLGFSLQINSKEYTSGSQLPLSSETIITTVALKIPGNTAKNLVIKPMIRKAEIEDNSWVPYMDKIGNYVDERFNGINAKLKVLNKTVLPLVTTADNGNILRVVDGQWASVALPNAEQSSF